MIGILGVFPVAAAKEATEKTAKRKKKEEEEGDRVFPVPFCVAARIPLLKPEFWLQLVLWCTWCTCANLARPSILILCGSINAYGLIVWAVKGRNNWAGYDAFRADVAEAEGDEAAGKFDKLCCRATSTSEESASNGTDSEEKFSGTVPLLETV